MPATSLRVSPAVRDGGGAGAALHSVADLAAVAILLDGGMVSPVFQAIVDLRTGCVVAYEALARGPRGHPLEAPDALFRAARSAGVLAALDATCLRTAINAARSGGLKAPWTLFVNIEPDSHSIDVLTALAPVSQLPVVVELTERALTEDPSDVLRTVSQIRQLGWGVALDDVGVNPDSLALLPLISPDVIKLDAAMVQRPPDEHTARVFSSVAAEQERTGCIVIAEGIETSDHLQAAYALGAHLGQGWLFDRPGKLLAPAADEPFAPLRLRRGAPSENDSTPFGVVSAAREVRRASKALLLAMSKHLEREAAVIGESCLVLSAFQTAVAFAPASSRYAALADNHAYIAVFGSGLTEMPARGVRGVDLDPGEPLSREWALVIIGPHFAAVLAARLKAATATNSSTAIDADTIEADTTWEYVLSHNRDVAVRAASTLMHRISRAERAYVPAP